MVGDRISKGLREDVCSQKDVLRVRKAGSHRVGWFQRTFSRRMVSFTVSEN